MRRNRNAFPFLPFVTDDAETLYRIHGIRDDEDVDSAHQADQAIDDRALKELLPAAAARVADHDLCYLMSEGVVGQGSGDVLLCRALDTDLQTPGEGEIVLQHLLLLQG